MAKRQLLDPLQPTTRKDIHVSYSTLARLSSDNSLHTRITACAALEGMENIEHFVWENRWKFAAQPGWDAAYASAIAGGKSLNPGDDGTVITDSMILSAVQKIRSETTAS